jgi:hypothetical protein
MGNRKPIHDYDHLLGEARLSPERVDFTELRMAYAETSEYAPYGENVDQRHRILDSVDERAPGDIIEEVESLLELSYLDVWAHWVAAKLYDDLGDRERALYHKGFGQRILESVLRSGDGMSFGTAFMVIDVGEEYAVLSALGIHPKRQMLLNEDGHQYDTFEYVSEAGRTKVMYFNIDVPMGRLNEIFGELEDSDL